MKFSLLLFILSRKLKKAARKHPSFRDRLKEKDFTICIRTKDGAKARSFTFGNGAVTSVGSVAPNPAVSLVWEDAATAFAVMSKGSNEATMKALSEGKLKIEGDANFALWFSETVKQMMKLK
ncbi:MAG: SCP2 sterol-binding domain-containing protein [Spirochaetes bacterium]|nr:SCP2 sterol-binding domain-containing protein [Spirochaetota bacterium]